MKDTLSQTLHYFISIQPVYLCVCFPVCFPYELVNQQDFMQGWDPTPKKYENYDVILASTAIHYNNKILNLTILVLKNFLRIYRTLAGVVIHACTLCMHLHSPPPGNIMYLSLLCPTLPGRWWVRGSSMLFGRGICLMGGICVDKRDCPYRGGLNNCWSCSNPLLCPTFYQPGKVGHNI